MKREQLIDFLQNANIVVPLMYFKKYKLLNISLEEFIFLMYLKDKGESFPFDSQKMALELGMSNKEILGLISGLADKKLLLIDTFKNAKGTFEENINLSLFYEKFADLISDDVFVNVNKEVDSSIFLAIEREFGRTLNPSEVEVIKAWSSNFNTDLILEAVKEATLNGVSSIRYIDKILYDWDKKGIKSREDVSHILNNKKENKEPVEVFDYDWFDDDEEE